MARRTLLLILALVPVISGCTLLRAGYVATKSPEELPQVSKVLPMHAEPGAESLAREIEAAWPAAKAKIEVTHGGALPVLPPIVVCATEACYRRYAAVPVSAGETLKDWRISINGHKITSQGRNAAPIFTHELSHLFWSSRGILFQPRWFEEGLAVWVSDGGGAEGASVADAVKAIAEGRVFEPTLESGAWAAFNLRLPAGMDWPLFYRQSGLFVQFLHDRDPAAFNRLLGRVRVGGVFAQAWEQTYPQGMGPLWQAFTSEISRGR